jgi:tetratricopeptide (TPR) repeat protein
MYFVRWARLSVALLVCSGIAFHAAVAKDTSAAGHPSQHPSTSASAPQIPQLTPETIADLLVVHHQYLEAIAAYQKLSPRTARIYNKIGVAYEHMLMVDDAKSNFERAIKMDKKFAEAYNNLGTVYYHQKDYGKAERLYKKAIHLSSTDAAVYSNLGALYLSRNKFQDGAEAYQRAFILDSNIFQEVAETGIPNSESMADLANMNFCFAKIYAQAGINNLAIEYLQKSIMEGYHDKVGLQQDQEFAGLRRMPEFQQLISSERR